MPLMLNVLPASNGDSIIIRYGDDKTNLNNILVDGGKGFSCFNTLKQFFKERNDENHNIELVIITHVDDDHINGILKLVQDPHVNKKIVKDIWFNSGKIISEFFKPGMQNSSKGILIDLADDTKMSVNQGITLEHYLENLGIWSKKLIKSTDSYECAGAVIKILSPNTNALNQLNENWEFETINNTDMAFTSDYHISIEDLLKNEYSEDTSIPNKSSIGFIFEYKNSRLLMLGDSHPSVIIESLHNLGYSKKNKLKVDFIKISHHGSKSNTSSELLDLIDCKKFIISTNGSQHGLPHKECLARIINHFGKDTVFYFNYDLIDRIFSKSEIDKFGFKFQCLNNNEFLIVEE